MSSFDDRTGRHKRYRRRMPEAALVLLYVTGAALLWWMQW